MSDRNSGDGGLTSLILFLLVLFSLFSTCSNTKWIKVNTSSIEKNTEDINKKLDTLIHLIRIQNGKASN